MTSTYELALHPVGVVRSGLTSKENAPLQGSEGAPEAWVEIDPAFADAFADLANGDEIILITWLHLGRRDILKVHPRGDLERPMTGVFATRSSDRPNPIGLHRVRILEIEMPERLRVRPLEALDGTPVLDIKPVLSGLIDG
jgi:tRNA-Thr(GGU) m(6)t(6)A37 methyltransferase TsaA